MAPLADQEEVCVSLTRITVDAPDAILSPHEDRPLSDLLTTGEYQKYESRSIEFYLSPHNEGAVRPVAPSLEKFLRPTK